MLTDSHVTITVNHIWSLGQMWLTSEVNDFDINGYLTCISLSVQVYHGSKNGRPFQVLLPRFVAFFPVVAPARRLRGRGRLRRRRRRSDCGGGGSGGGGGYRALGVCRQRHRAAGTGRVTRRTRRLRLLTVHDPLQLRHPRHQNFQVHELVLRLELFQLGVGGACLLEQRRRRVLDGGERRNREVDRRAAAAAASGGGRQHEVIVINIRTYTQRGRLRLGQRVHRVDGGRR